MSRSIRDIPSLSTLSFWFWVNILMNRWWAFTKLTSRRSVAPPIINFHYGLFLSSPICFTLQKISVLLTSSTVPGPGKISRPSLKLEQGLSTTPFRSVSSFFRILPRFFSNLLVSIDVARLLAAFPGFASGFNIHQEDFPVPSFWTRMKRLCSDRLWRIEFYITNNIRL